MSDLAAPSEEVLDLFAVPGPGESLPGGQGGSVHAGDLVLSPGRDQTTSAWLNPVLARLAVRLDERPGRRPRDLRVAMPVPARDGAWVVQGWGASRYEPGTTACRDLDVTLAAGRLLHAELAVAVPRRPPELSERTDRWARAEALAFGETGPMLRVAATLPGSPVVSRLVGDLDDVSLGVEQLVHADLAGNVLLDQLGAPVVIDVAPSWRAPVWAEAVCVLDSVMWQGAAPTVLARWTGGREQQAMLRAVAFRALSDVEDLSEHYRPVLDVIAPRGP